MAHKLARRRLERDCPQDAIRKAPSRRAPASAPLCAPATPRAPPAAAVKVSRDLLSASGSMLASATRHAPLTHLLAGHPTPIPWRHPQANQPRDPSRDEIQPDPIETEKRGPNGQQNRDVTQPRSWKWNANESNTGDRLRNRSFLLACYTRLYR